MKSKTDLVMEAMDEAVPYARTCCRAEIQDDELTSLCYETMMKCAKRYDPKRGKFFAFCKPRIRGALLRYWNTTGTTVRNADCVSLDSGTYNRHMDSERETEHEGIVYPDGSAGEVEPDFDRINFREQWAQVSKFMAEHCTDREHAILQMVFSMNMTFEEAGSLFDISRAAAQAIAAKIIERIKKALVK